MPDNGVKYNTRWATSSETCGYKYIYIFMYKSIYIPLFMYVYMQGLHVVSNLTGKIHTIAIV